MIDEETCPLCEYYRERPHHEADDVIVLDAYCGRYPEWTFLPFPEKHWCGEFFPIDEDAAEVRGLEEECEEGICAFKPTTQWSFDPNLMRED
jgi:hypothetical protein